MRSFCTEGPIDTNENYYLPREALLELGLQKIDKRRYFTIFAPRQSGKTTYFQLLIDEIRQKRKDYLPIWVTFESFGNASLEDFFALFYLQCEESLSAYMDASMKRRDSIPMIEMYIRDVIHASGKELILIIDEVEGLKNRDILNALMHTIRSIYHRSTQVKLRSVILTGVSNITGIIQDNASPFNIADQLQLPYFTNEEVFQLLGQHERETGQTFDSEVKEAIFQNTLGQPGLVCALARDLVEKKCSGGERVEMNHFYLTLDDFTRVYIDKNIGNVLNKAKQYPQIIKEILFGNGVAFDTSDERISFLRVNGVIDDCDGFCCIKVPIYKKRIYNAFKPIMNGEKNHFVEIKKRMEDFQEEDGKLKMIDIIHNYAKYLKRRGNIIFNNPNEGEYQYNLDAYLHSICEFLGGTVYPEVPEGGGRVDLLVLKNAWKWIIEAKVLSNISYIEKGKAQLLEYLKRSGIEEGFLIFFTESVELEAFEDEEREGKKLFTWVMPIQRKTPSALSR